ncbi:hypothetical protein DWQ65_05715 [Treponema phagedenis]|uniref:Uncharacterized protein n=1 Tax=Treponema phagedenis TaxID=162 RepID=A0A0B7GVB4_TREPH|nr:DUF5312 family protein [Treponema phagedenis]NVP24619.1 hypothetical protein [Treponema phagedenis]QEK00594.1 hypothetical protein FUT84_05050 [Treponema phagedenis]QEK05604.1 hypothetical protein FUT80_01970 [Treponema phagedenis]QKS91920.1 hypothetical protein HPJ96_04655 [Treponema phagedenis]QLC58817.1 hypothetical protein HW453_08360 [Treponema phagedenis]
MKLISTIIESIRDFIEAIFFSSSPEYQVKRNLRLIMHEIRQIQPQVYRADKTLLPGFASGLFQLFGFIQPLKEILEKTIHSKDIRIATKSYDLLFDELLSPTENELQQSFAIKNRALEFEGLTGESFEKKLQDQSKTFKQFMQLFENEKYKQKNMQVKNLSVFSDFCNFDFITLFAAFDPQFLNINEKKLPITPRFREVKADTIVQQLLDFNYLFKNLIFDDALVYSLALLAKKNTKESIENIQSSISKNLTTIKNFFEKKLGVHTIANILKHIKNDPDFTDKTPDISVNYLEEYVQRQISQFNADSKKLLRIQQENKITDLVIKTFGTASLIPLEGYTDSINEALQATTTLSLDWVRPLEIIHTFTQNHFEIYCKPFLRELLIEGFFLDKQFQMRLSSSYYFCESINEKLSAFESLFKENGSCSVRIIQGYISELENGGDFEKALQKIINTANAQAKYLMQKIVTQYTELFNASIMILDDTKKILPEYISNIKALVTSQKNKDSYKSFEEEIECCRNFLEIMKNYAILGSIEPSAS